MFDVFYKGTPPKLFAHERSADSIEHAQRLSRTRFFWWINYLTEYTDFDFLWEPPPWQADQRHAWASQWQKDSGTYLVPRLPYQDTNYHARPMVNRLPKGGHWLSPTHTVEAFDYSWHPDPSDPPYIYHFATQHQKTGGPIYHVPGATEIKYMDMMRAQISSETAPVVEIDHMDGNAGQISNTIRKIRYFDNYRDTLIRLARSLEGQYEHVWVCSSICDYSQFDFSWHPEIWQSTMLHVFASDDQKFGDTFYMHVPTFVDRAECKALLEWTSVNFVPGRSVPRRPISVCLHDCDSHVDSVKNYIGTEPVTVFADRDPGVKKWPAVNLWRAETKAVIPLDPGAGVVLVPKAAVPSIKTQIYDYAYIDKTRNNWLQAPALDVVFISNGERNAEDNWNRLQKVMVGQPNRVLRLNGVNGRVQAYQAAARLSTTPWFFAVFAKLHVSDQFDWAWQPDKLQQAKHYIFHAHNPVNGLEYGHQAMIAYNQRMTLINTGQGLDFTLDQPHEVVPLLSGVANYADTAWSAWRTAFRETIKLRHSLPDVESEYRLDKWLSIGHGTWGSHSVMGAQDAIEFYDQVKGDFTELRKSYEWSWLSTYAGVRRPQLFTQSRT